MNKTVRYLLYSQVILFVTLVVCTIIDPHYLFSSDQGGISNYGAQFNTLIPYTVGLSACSVYIFLAARSLGGVSKAKMLRALLYILVALQLSVIVSTFAYKISESWYNIHIYSTQVYFLAELFMGAWFAFRAKTQAVAVLYGVFLVGFVLALLTLFGKLHILFIAEVMTAFTFGAIMIVGSKELTRSRYSDIDTR